MIRDETKKYFARRPDFSALMNWVDRYSLHIALVIVCLALFVGAASVVVINILYRG